jgi:23S rRNA pseudouridine2605 synthase
VKVSYKIFNPGLILLTNDGKLKKYMEHPSSKIERTYLVRIKGNVTEQHLNKFESGSNIKGVNC